MSPVDQDPDRPGVRVLWADGLRQSWVDLHDPTHLQLHYTQRIADAVDTAFDPGRALRAVHLGGGGMTLPRWLAATRPGSTQLVLEVDPEVAAAATGMGDVDGLELAVLDAGAGVAALEPACAELVVGDAFTGREVPEHLLDPAHVARVARALTSDGAYLLNLIDDPPFSRTREALGSIRAAWAQVGIVADPSVLSGRLGGNLVVVATGSLDWDALTGRASRRPGRPTVLAPAAAAAWLDGGGLLR